jgi:hypothetical protein
VEAPLTDCAGYIAANVGLERKAVKKVLNPMLHQQTQGNLFGVGNRETLEDRKKVERFLRSKWPLLWDRIQSLKGDLCLLQRRGAQVFFPAYAETLRREQLPAGIPMHDGWIFAAEEEAQAVRVKDIFERVGRDLLGQQVLVTHEILR